MATLSLDDPRFQPLTPEEEEKRKKQKKITEANISSGDATFDIGGSAWDSSYDVYKIVLSNIQLTSTSDDARINCRVLKSDNSPDTTSNYDYAYKVLNSASSFGNGAFTNDTEWQYLVADSVGTGTSESANGILYLFNFNNASEYSFITAEVTEINSSATARGNQGGGVHTVQSSSDGVFWFDTAGGNIASGTFTLYGLKK